MAITPDPSTIAAIKKAAIAKAKAMGKEINIPMDELDDTPATPKAPEPAIKWPTVLKNTGAAFSELFPREWNDVKDKGNPDFNVPCFKSYAYPEWMKAYIPVDSDYRGDSQLIYDAALAYAAGSVTHVVGWPGTGKTNGLPVYMAEKLNLPILRLGLNKKGMMFDDLIGREAIRQTAAGMETSHRDGLLIPWIEHPCIILADEFARANAEISNGLMSLMERNGCLIVENRASPVIKRHEHCWIVASDNVKGLGDGAGKFVGTDMVDNAVLDRMEVTLEVDYLPESEQIALINQWFPGFPEKEAQKLVKFGSLIQQGYKKDTLPLSFSPRALKETARYACLHQNMAQAVRKVVLAKFAEESDVQAIKEMYRTAFGKAL